MEVRMGEALLVRYRRSSVPCWEAVRVRSEAIREVSMSQDESSPRPVVVDRPTFEEQLEVLRSREKAHTREGDAIAASRRRLPMVEVAADSPLLGSHGPVTLLDAFEGRVSSSLTTSCGGPVDLPPTSAKAAHG
jgi:hypothetical protein